MNVKNYNAHAAILISLTVGLISAAVFLALPTQQYSGDGMRYYATISGLAPAELSGTNHLLYAPLARAYFSLATALGAVPSFQLAQTMNALFGGAALACFVFILLSLSQRSVLAVAASVALGFARAFSLHAADMTEPMPGVFLSLLGMAFVVVALEKPCHIFLFSIFSGVAIGAASALYQSNVFTVFGAASFILLAAKVSFRQRMTAAILCICMAACVAVGLYIAAFMTIGKIPSVPEALRATFITENELTQGIYQEIGLRRVGVLIFGLADSMFGLRFIDGQSANFFKDGLTPRVLWTLALVAWSVIALAAILFVAFRSRRLSTRTNRLILACAIWLVPQFGLLLFFGARYSKLWILPLATLLIILVLVVNQTYPQQVSRGVFWGMWIAPIVIGGLLFNLMPDHINPNPAVQAAQKINAQLTERDLVITQWGGLPYTPVPRMQTVGLVPLAIDAKLSAVDALDKLSQFISATQNSGGTVYFYELLDYSEIEWQPFFRDRLRVPYTSFDSYRTHSQKVMLVGTTSPDGAPLYLWRFQMP